MKALLIIPQLDHSGSAKQLGLLAENLPRDRFECRVGVLGPEGPGNDRLRKAGLQVETIGWRRWLDPGPLVRLRRLVREFRPDLVHVWRPLALRAISLVGANGARLVMSAPLGTSDRRATHPMDRWLSRRVERVVVSGSAQADRCLRAGITAEKLVVIPPAVKVEPTVEMESERNGIAGLDRKARLLACVGPLHAHKGFRDAVWAFDILRYVADSLNLLLIGDGPDRARLRQFIQDSRTADRVHMLGPRDDVPTWFGRTETAGVPSREGGGVNVALEAMAAGRPVVASRLSELAEVVLDGQTGFLVPPGDKMALARQTRVLLENPERRRQLGEAGRQRALRHFGVADLVRRFVDLYENQKG